jgi:hypothetical protein
MGSHPARGLAIYPGICGRSGDNVEVPGGRSEAFSGSSCHCPVRVALEHRLSIWWRENHSLFSAERTTRSNGRSCLLVLIRFAEISP